MLGKEAKRKLKYARSRAKLAEFSVDRTRYPNYSSNPEDLHYSAIRVLSNYSSARIAGDKPVDFLNELNKAASFYNAAADSASSKELSDGYWQIAMATYFLLGNYGSAKVAAARIENREYYGINSRVLTELILFLLSSGAAPRELPTLTSYLTGEVIDTEDVLAEASQFRGWSSPEDLFFGDLLYVAISDVLKNCSRQLLPDYSSLPLSVWRSFLSASDSNMMLWQAQKAIGRARVFSGSNAFVQLPTGSGKTKSIELLIRSRIYAGKDTTAIIVAPLRALCSEITADLSSALGELAEVKQSSEVQELDDWLSATSQKPRVLVFTPEKLGFVIRHEKGFLESAGLFVFDESHLIDNVTRGPAYEMLLSEILFRHKEAQYVFISAVVSNAADLAGWAFGNPNDVVSSPDIQVTEKSIGVLKRVSHGKPFGSKVAFSKKENPFEEDFFVPIDIEKQNLSLRGRERKPREFPDCSTNSALSRDSATIFADRLAGKGASAIYIPKKNSVWSFFSHLSDCSSRGLCLSRLSAALDEGEKAGFKYLFGLHYGPESCFSDSLELGILPHYGNLQGEIRSAVEHAVQDSKAKCIVCTSTLAEGVNLPIRYLFITGVSTGREKTKTRDFQNLIGRVARSGKYSEGTIFLTDPELCDQRTQKEYSRLCEAGLTEKCESAINNLIKDEPGPNPMSQSVIPGPRIANVILENISNPLLESMLSGLFCEAFKCDKATGDAMSSRRIRALEAIECYVADALEAGEGDIDIMKICVSTYAYHCLDEEDQEYLIKVFEAVLEKVSGSDVVQFCAKSHMGLRRSLSMMQWLESPQAQSFFSGNFADLKELVDGFYYVTQKDASRISTDSFAVLVDCWLDGKNIKESMNALNELITAEDKKAINEQAVEKELAQSIKYAFSHFISCVIDALEEKTSLAPSIAIEKLKEVQRFVKYGTRSIRTTIICEELFDDRFVSRLVFDVIGDGAADRSAVNAAIVSNQDSITETLENLPSYFMHVFERWIKNRNSE